MLGIGIDVVEIGRVRSARFLDRLAEYVLLPSERSDLERCADAARYIASRFAVKEAVIKAVSAPLTYQDIEVTKEGPRPMARIVVPGANGVALQVSLSHERGIAIGIA